ncbi:MBL fold metallo-hydrolase [Streptomyces sp. NPDC005373]|uniref:MBL fold metallo-hydrolase n=1 Tax=Streptomyces sp. NPDC005373 TaxID=3156879 RepID=UPI0033A02045
MERVRSGIWSIPVLIPDSPLRYVNCYVVETGAGLVMVDPGWPAEVAWQALREGVARVGLDLADVTGVVVSHAHADHHGLAVRVREVSGCWVAVHRADADLLDGLRDGRAVERRDGTWLAECGIPEAERAALRLDPAYSRQISVLDPDHRIDAEDVGGLTRGRIEALWTPGHTPGHLCLRVPGESVILTGDHVLPRITPTIGTYSSDGRDALADYLRSLSEVAVWVGDAAVEVLPGHEYRFRDLPARVEAMRRHHRARLDEVEAVLAEAGAATTVWDVARRLTWSRSWEETTGHLRRLALAETLAHLVRLRAEGRVRAGPGTPVLWSPEPGPRRLR